MLRRMCAWPLRRIGSMARSDGFATAKLVPAAKAERKNWRRVEMVMVTASEGNWRVGGSIAGEERKGRAQSFSGVTLGSVRRPLAASDTPGHGGMGPDRMYYIQ